MKVFNSELFAIGLTLRESGKIHDTLQPHGVTKVGVFSDFEAAIRRTEHLELGPGMHLA